MWFNEDSKVPHWMLIGIASFGPIECGARGIPGVYTKVPNFLKWIAEHRIHH